MKKLILLIFIITGSFGAKAQTFHSYADTANYLINQIKYKKNVYIGHPLSVLMDSLRIQPVRAFTAGLTQQQGTFGKTISLYFNNQDDFSKTHIIILEFANVPSYSQLFPVFHPSMGVGGSLQSILTVYRPFTVTGVWVKNYKEDEPVNPDVHY